MVMRFDDTTATWKAMLRALLGEGRRVASSSAGSEWRGKTTNELLAYQTVVDMTLPVVRSPGRGLSSKFLVAEAAWIVSGDNRWSTLAPFAPRKVKEFSDDGVRFFGAYGPRFVDQLSYVVGCLAKDPASRQAVVQIWRPLPPSSKDVPCTLSWQFLVRDDDLHCVATMRSSDAWYGWVYDVFNFSMAAAVVALELKKYHGVRYGLGGLRFTAGSQHLYVADFDVARAAVAEPPDLAYYAPLDLDEFEGPDELVAHLWSLARRDGTAKRNWLRELFP